MITSVQSDRKVRVVALANLEAMIKRESGRGAKFSVGEETKTRVKVHLNATFAQEFGYVDVQFTAIYPLLGSNEVILEAVDYRADHKDWRDSAGDMFVALESGPVLWRNNDQWETEEEIEERQRKEKNEYFLEGQAKESLIHPDTLRMLRNKSGKTWVAFENQDLSSSAVGGLRFLAYDFENLPGKGTRMPDTKDMNNWQYYYKGIVDVTTGLIS